LAIDLSVVLRYTDYDYPFGIFKLFLENTEGAIKHGQSTETGNIGYIRHKNDDKQNKNTTQYVFDTIISDGLDNHLSFLFFTLFPHRKG
jgi:hypothetical protein